MINCNFVGNQLCKAREVTSPYGKSSGKKLVERIRFEGFNDEEHYVAIARTIGFFDKFICNRYVKFKCNEQDIYINKNSLIKRFSNRQREFKILQQFVNYLSLKKEHKPIYQTGQVEVVPIQQAAANIPLIEEPNLDTFDSLRFLNPDERVAIRVAISEAIKKTVRKPTKIEKKEKNIARSILLTPEGKFLLLTSAKKKNDLTLGKGAAKQVKIAVNLETGEERALAIIRRKPKGKEVLSNSIWNSFVEEADLIRRFKGKEGVVQIDTAFFIENAQKEQDKIYIIMERSDLGNLSDAISNKKEPLQPNDLFQIAKDIAIGVKNIHDKGIIHRDIKLKNILLFRKDNEQIHAKVCDFGSAFDKRNADDGEHECFTLGYHSPERSAALIAPIPERPARVKAITTEKIDVWDLGILFYRLFNTSHKPFLPFDPMNIHSTLTSYSLIQQQRAEEIVNQSQMDEQLKPLIKSMLSVDPDKRPDMAEVVRQLNVLAPHFPRPYPLNG